MESEDNKDSGLSSDLDEYLEFSKARSPLTDRVVYELSNILFNTDKIRMISRLNPVQIRDIFNVIMVNELFLKRYMNPKSPLYSIFDEGVLSKLLELMISEKGMGREDIREMVSGMNLMFRMSKNQPKMSGR